MAQERNALKVGIVTVVVIVVFFVILLWISQHVGGEMQLLTIRFKSTPDMPTLTPGSAVLVGGQKVGRVVAADVKSLAIPDAKTGKTKQDFYVVVNIELRGDLKLRSDYRAVPEGPPLGGDGVVTIDLGTAADDLDIDALPEKMLPGSDPAGFNAVLTALQSEFDGDNPGSLLGQIKAQLDPEGGKSLMAKLLQSLDDINQMTGSLNRELNGEQKAALLAKIHEVVDNINATTGAMRREFDAEQPAAMLGKVHLAMNTLNDGLATVSGMMRHNEPVVTRTLEHVEQAAANVAGETDSTKADSLMSHFKEASRKLNASLADINEVTGTTRQLVVLNRENINRLLINFKEASDHIKTGVKYVLRHPWRLLNAPEISEIKQEAIFDATRSFTEAATRIDDAAARLAALSELHQEAIPADDPDLAKLLAELKQTQMQYRKAEEQLWKQLGGN